jgi:hypothetical protein
MERLSSVTWNQLKPAGLVTSYGPFTHASLSEYQSRTVMGAQEAVCFGFGDFSRHADVPDLYQSQVKDAFRRFETEEEFVPEGPKIREDDDVIKFMRVRGQDLDTVLLGPDGKSWLNQLYHGPLLEDIRLYLDNDGLEPFEESKLNYVGNGLTKVGHRFPIHKDHNTATALLICSDIPLGLGGEFIASLERNTIGQIALKKNIAMTVHAAYAGTAIFFSATDIVHGSLGISSDFPGGRYTIACNYKDNSYDPSKRPQKYKDHR